MAYIGYFPTSPGFTAINFKQNNQIKRTVTASGRTIRATNSTTIWSGVLGYPPMTLGEWLPIQGFIARANGGLNEFDVVMPTISQNSLGLTGLNITVASSAAAGTTSVSIENGPSATKILNPGDIIRFPNHTKVYMVTDNNGVTTDVSGLATINFEPALITAVDVPGDSAGEIILTDEVPFRMALTNAVQEFGYRTDGLVGYELDVSEVI